jgi:hypothetical protein
MAMPRRENSSDLFALGFPTGPAKQGRIVISTWNQQLTDALRAALAETEHTALAASSTRFGCGFASMQSDWL